LRSLGIPTTTARCFDGESELAYAPIVSIIQSLINQPVRASQLKLLPAYWLSEASRLLPELCDYMPNLPPPTTMRTGSQVHFYEALRQLMMALVGSDSWLAVFIDDLDMADQATVDFLTYLVHRIRNMPILILAAWKSTDLPVNHRLQQAVTEANRSGVGTKILLERLSESDVAEFTKAIPGMRAGSNIHERLFQESEGIPFFLVEYASMLQCDQQIGLEPDWGMPDRVRELLKHSLFDLDETKQQVLQTAAVIGRSFNYDLMLSASGRSELEVIQAVEALVAKGLIRERNQSVGFEELIFDFSHEKLRSLVFENTSQPRLRLLHRRVAETLMSQSFGEHQRLVVSKQVAYHYKMSGMAVEAARYSKIAGDYAFSVFANSDALNLYQEALSLGYPDRRDLHARIGELYVLLGEYENALNSLETALALTQAPAEVTRMMQRIGEVHDRRGDWSLAEKYFETALEILSVNNDQSERAKLLAVWSRSAFHRGDDKRAESLAHQALDLVHETSDQDVHILVHNILGILYRRQGDIEQALIHLQESLKEQKGVVSIDHKVAALNNLGLVYSDRGQPDEAAHFFDEALELCEALGDRHRAAAILNNLADLYNASGKTEDAMRYLKQAVVLFTQVGKDNESIRPEIWMLTEW